MPDQNAPKPESPDQSTSNAAAADNKQEISNTKSDDQASNTSNPQFFGSMGLLSGYSDSGAVLRKFFQWSIDSLELALLTFCPHISGCPFGALHIIVECYCELPSSEKCYLGSFECTLIQKELPKASTRSPEKLKYTVPRDPSGMYFKIETPSFTKKLMRLHRQLHFLTLINSKPKDKKKLLKELSNDKETFLQPFQDKLKKACIDFAAQHYVYPVTAKYSKLNSNRFISLDPTLVKNFPLTPYQPHCGWYTKKANSQKLHFDDVTKNGSCIYGYLNSGRHRIYNLEKLCKARYFGNYFDTLEQFWRKYPVLTVFSAYMIYTLLPQYTPYIDDSLDFTGRQKPASIDALVVTCHHASVKFKASRRNDQMRTLKAARLYADTNYYATSKPDELNWVDSLPKGVNTFSEDVKAGLFRNLTAFDIDEDQVLGLDSLKGWHELHKQGFSPLIWMPNLNQISLREDERKNVVVINTESISSELFQKNCVYCHHLWRIFCIAFLRDFKDDAEYFFDSPNGLPINRLPLFACKQTLDQMPWLNAPDAKEIRNLSSPLFQHNYGSYILLFSFSLFLQYLIEEQVIKDKTALDLYGICARELCRNLNVHYISEPEKLQTYLNDIYSNKYKPQFKFWVGKERNSGIECLYLDQKRWKEDYRKHCDSTLTDHELIELLSSCILFRSGRKSVGQMRVCPDDKSKGPIYVICLDWKKVKSKLYVPPKPLKGASSEPFIPKHCSSRTIMQIAQNLSYILSQQGISEYGGVEIPEELPKDHPLYATTAELLLKATTHFAQSVKSKDEDSSTNISDELSPTASPPKEQSPVSSPIQQQQSSRTYYYGSPPAYSGSVSSDEDLNDPDVDSSSDDWDWDCSRLIDHGELSYESIDSDLDIVPFDDDDDDFL